MDPARTLAFRTWSDGRIRLLSFGLLFGGLSAANVFGYRSTYPTVADRLKFAQTFGGNKAARLLLGTPYELSTVGGFAAWRAAGLLALFAAFFGLLAAVRAFRAEEESGRFELVVVGAITRRSAYLARIEAIGALIAGLWCASFIALFASGLPVSGSALLAAEMVVIALPYAAVGVISSQLMPTSRGALQLAGGVLGIDFVMRVIADTTDTQALHWMTPLGWSEELRAFADARPWVLALFLLATAVLLVIGLILESRRDVGAGLLSPGDLVHNPSLRFVRSLMLMALRSQGTTWTVWTAGIASLAFIVGTISTTVASGLSAEAERQLNKLGISALTPAGYIGLTFLFFLLAISLFCCSQLAGIREEEAEGRLETLFALPASRSRWFASRIALAASGAVLLAIVSGLAASGGATAAGADVSTLRLVGAGFNVLPASLLFLGVGALFVAAVPRNGVAVAYAIVVLAFTWELVGALLNAPPWLLGVSPFHQIGLIPAAPFRPLPAGAMLGVAIVAAALAVVRFRSRDLVGP